MKKERIEKGIEKVVKKIDLMMNYYSGFPGEASEGLRYRETENHEWTPGFWTGMLWLAYEYTGENKYREKALGYMDSFEERLRVRGKGIETHDIGFLYTLSAVAGYKLTGDKRHRETAIKAADTLMERYLEKGGIIQAWGDLNNPEQRGRMIIDCNMNLPLLYWTSEVTGDKKYYDAAYNHCKQAQKYIIRDDNSTYHTYYIDTESGEGKFGKTHQGKSDNSCWARGQAWAVYGFVLSYIFTRDETLLKSAVDTLEYFIERTPQDLVCYWDLDIKEGSYEPRDSSAMAILNCGIHELLKHDYVEGKKAAQYKKYLKKVSEKLDDLYVSESDDELGVLLHSTYSKPGNVGVDEFNLWGDYFYFESLMRQRENWELYW